MSEVNHLLFIEPERHMLIYGSCVMAEIVEAFKKPEYVIREIKGGDAIPDKINDAITEVRPIMIWGVGHGHVCVYSVECTTVYMTVRSGSHRACDRDRNLDKAPGRVIHLNSCYTARELGPALIDRGAVTYYGSREPFWLYIGSPACSDRASRTVFLAELQVEASLLDGKTTGEAKSDQTARYDEEIEYWTTGPGKDHPYAAGLVRILTIDKGIATMLGRDDVVVCVPVVGPPPPYWWIVAMAAGMTPLIVVGGVVTSEEARKMGVLV